MKLAIIDLLGLTYDGDTLKKRGLGGSESAVILMSHELSKIGFDVTVYNHCIDSEAKPGTYNNVKYIDHSQFKDDVTYDIVISSRSVFPFFATNKYGSVCSRAKHKVVWMHDTFCEGDQNIEDMLNRGFIDELFTLSDFHSTYVLNCDHGQKRNFEVLKNKVFMTRNGAVKHIKEIDLKKKDPDHFVYNASVTKGLTPLLEDIWPEVKKNIPNAKLTVIGGYYRFREGAEPDAQEKQLKRYREEISDELDITFTGVIPQYEIADILSKATFMIYPTEFPETFGISTMEALLCKTPVITCNFGALEETAIDLACYKINYPNMPNGLFRNVNRKDQAKKFIAQTLQAHGDRYLLQQKQNYCDVIDDIHGWDTVALQWKQHLYKKLEKYLSVNEYRKVSRINKKVARIFGRRFSNEEERNEYTSYGKQNRIVVISPFYNAQNYLRDHVQSVMQQDYDNYLHVMINDASTDQSLKVVEEFKENNLVIVSNKKNLGCIANQLMTIDNYVKDEDIVMLLDGDDFLISNNTIFHYYNDLYNNGIEFTYGSCWSLADEIPLIAQDYPQDVKDNKSYRSHHFNWKIPYTHLRTFKGSLIKKINREVFKKDGVYMKSGMDNPLFYELIEQCHPEKIKAVKEVMCFYNDINPLNDYKVNTKEQNENASVSYKKKDNTMKKILIAVPTNKNVETDTFKSIYDLIVPEGFTTQLEFFYGYQIDQVRNLIADWGKRYDYLFCVDSDIVLPKDSLIKLLKADKDIISGIYIQRHHDRQVPEIYRDTEHGQKNYDVSTMPNGVFSVSACGFGCVLIKGEVLEKMEYPHFVYKSAINHANTISEDVYFCNKAKQNGFTIWADSTIICDHVGKHVFKPQVKRVQPETFNAEERLRELSNQRLLPQPHVDYLKKIKKDFEFEPEVIYDIGACVLHWTNEAEKVWDKSQYIAFEAMDSCQFLYKEKNIKHAIAVLSDKTGKMVDFYRNDYHPGGNSYYLQNEKIAPETPLYFNEGNKQKVATVALDDAVKAGSFPLPDLVKMDVQGAELDILKGGKDTISNAKHVILELQEVEYNTGAPLREEVIKYMDNIGFDFVKQFSNNGPDGDYHFKRRMI